MIKKVLTIVASYLLFMSAANAQVNMGLSAIYLDVEATGQNTLKTTNVVTNTTHNDDGAAGEIFIEHVDSNGLTLGLAVIPMDAEVGTKSVTRTDKLTSGDVTGAQKAAAEFSMHTTIYALVPLGSSGAFLKLGAGFVEVKSTESLITGAKYGDETVNFGTIGLGFQKDFDSGVFARVEGAYSDYEELKLVSTGSDATSTIKGEIETYTGKISVGKSF
ncbi:hypothetical protein OAS43_01040 [Candidatus Pelagibacter sp.]|nr:hypothetical protein [Candidatus Pelagibacter sp.]